MLAECPVHELTAGLGYGQAEKRQRELKALLQPSRNWPYHQAGAYAHLNQNLRIKANVRYLLLGKNGVGKSTLLKAIAHRDNGLQEFPKHCTTFLLDQELKFLRESILSGKTVLEAVLKHANWKLRSLQLEADRLENEDIEGIMSEEEVCERLCEIYDEMEECESQAQEREHLGMLLLKGLGFRKGRENSKIASLSGGWQARVGLACALVHNPDLLLLDEPTNHLDVHAIVWLSKYLSKKYNGALLIVTHDRQFAQEVGTDVILFADQKLEYFNNFTLEGFEDAALEKKKKMDHLMSNLDKHKEALRKQKQQMNKAAHAGNEKAGKAAAKLAKKLGRIGLEKTADGRKWNLQRDGVRVGADNNNCGGWVKGRMTNAHNTTADSSQTTLGFGFHQMRCSNKNQPEAEATSTAVFELRKPKFRYGREGFSLVCGEFPIGLHCRLAICGANGQGKTTLLRLLTGELEPKSGEVRRGPYRVMHFAQSSHDELAQDSRSPLERLLDAKAGQKEYDVRQFLAKFGIRGDQALRSMTNLSGGQRVRVAMALGALSEPHVLILDEPTNHLDMNSVDALGECLKNFDGGVILCTHDRSLIKTVATEILLVDEGKADLFKGTPQEYVARLR
jgi:ATPase subunit of ABC transporter with duplicated ATPase domains